MTVTLVLGGARSGKSRYAENLASGERRIYVATAQVLDAEMQVRIARHREQRGSDWETVETPTELLDALKTADGEGRFILVDCITLWISNLLIAGAGIASNVEALVQWLPKAAAQIVLVSNEVGLGIVPDNALARKFRDEAGLANQRLAEAADEVVFLAAGLPLPLKKPPQQ